MSPEVLMYVQSIRNYLKTNEESRTYFLSIIDEELFFTHLTEIAQKNFDKDGEAMLTQSQFEDLRRNLITFTQNQKQLEKLFEEIDNRIIFDTKEHGIIFLN